MGRPDEEGSDAAKRRSVLAHQEGLSYDRPGLKGRKSPATYAEVCPLNERRPHPRFHTQACECEMFGDPQTIARRSLCGQRRQAITVLCQTAHRSMAVRIDFHCKYLSYTQHL
jgi:hypothetical protein